MNRFEAVRLRLDGGFRDHQSFPNTTCKMKTKIISIILAAELPYTYDSSILNASCGERWGCFAR